MNRSGLNLCRTSHYPAPVSSISPAFLTMLGLKSNVKTSKKFRFNSIKCIHLDVKCINIEEKLKIAGVNIIPKKADFLDPKIIFCPQFEKNAPNF